MQCYILGGSCTSCIILTDTKHRAVFLRQQGNLLFNIELQTA